MRMTDPLIGTWKLDVTKTRFDALLQVDLKEATAVYRKIDADNIEVAATGTRMDGSPISFKATFPRQGGATKVKKGDLREGISGFVTVIHPSIFYLTILQNGKQVLVFHSVISRDGKTKRDKFKGFDAEGKPYRGQELWEKQ